MSSGEIPIKVGPSAELSSHPTLVISGREVSRVSYDVYEEIKRHREAQSKAFKEGYGFLSRAVQDIESTPEERANAARLLLDKFVRDISDFPPEWVTEVPADLQVAKVEVRPGKTDIRAPRDFHDQTKYRGETLIVRDWGWNISNGSFCSR